MTHPDTLIPRAVVEQALNAMLGVVYGDPVFGDQAKSAITSLRAALQPQADTSVLQAAPWPPSGDTQTEPEAMRYDFDGYGWKYIDNGSGSDWMTRHPEGEFLFTKPQAASEPVNEWKEAVLDAVAAYSMDFRMDVPPCVIVNQLLGMAVTMAKDPAIRKEAATAPITCQYCHSDSGEVMWHCNNCGNKDQPYTAPPATQTESPLLKDYVEKAVAAERRKWQAALTAALEALKEIASMEGTESNEWDGVERVIPEMCAVAKAAIARLEALGVK